MRVFISADMEGCCGVVSWGQCGRPSGDHYDYAFARRMMTEDVNAAVRGALAAGATEVLVKDSHGNSKNLLLDQLEPGAALVSGIGPEAHGMMAGLRPEFDAAVLVGYHAMAGTRAGVLAHTYTGTVHRLAVNGQPAGEIYLSYATAGWMGVPVVAVVSDDKGCAEASALDPATHTVATKHGRGASPPPCGPRARHGPRLSAPSRQPSGAERRPRRSGPRRRTPSRSSSTSCKRPTPSSTCRAGNGPTAIRSAPSGQPGTRRTWPCSRP